MTDYVSCANKVIREALSQESLAVVFGQNVAAGSRLGGLARGLDDLANCTVFNTPNCENGLVGMGLGLMLDGVSSVFMMKQQDFLLLGVDQLFNTWSALKERSVQTPFVICTIVVDSGWEGPQSSFNNSVGLAQLCRIPTFTPASEDQLATSVRQAFGGGPAILALSQRMFREEAWTPGSEWTATERNGFSSYCPTGGVGQASMAVISVNFAFPHAIEMAAGNSAHLAHLWRPEQASISELASWATGFDDVILVDDSKSIAPVGDQLAHSISSQASRTNVRLVRREDSERWHLPRADQLVIAGSE